MAWWALLSAPERNRKGSFSIGLALALEGLGDVLDGDLRRHLAVQVAAHAVGDDHQQRVARIAVGDAVLVGRALAGTAFLVDGEFHAASAGPPQGGGKSATRSRHGLRTAVAPALGAGVGGWVVFI
jgi:hypothetical protein